MKEFRKLAFDLRRCRQELVELQKFLATGADLNEEEHIRPFIEARHHLSAFLAVYNPDITRFDLLAYQYPLGGDFTCDLVVGDSVKKAYSFIEFEDAGPRSLFVKRGKKATREWSPRFDHGYSQLIDWFYKLDDMEKSNDFEARFGARSISFTGVLVVGRDQHLGPGEKARLDWRKNNVAVRSQTIRCVTFDGLLEDLLGRLKTFTLAAKAGG
jgi:hypothetical protein